MATEIDTFQRRLLRKILYIRWAPNNWNSNDKLIETKQIPWSKTIAKRCIYAFWNISADFLKTSMQRKRCTRHWKKTRSGHKPTLQENIEGRLDNKCLSFDQALQLFKGMVEWRSIYITIHLQIKEQLPYIFRITIFRRKANRSKYHCDLTDKKQNT